MYRAPGGAANREAARQSPGVLTWAPPRTDTNGPVGGPEGEGPPVAVQREGHRRAGPDGDAAVWAEGERERHLAAAGTRGPLDQDRRRESPAGG